MQIRLTDARYPTAHIATKISSLKIKLWKVVNHIFIGIEVKLWS